MGAVAAISALGLIAAACTGGGSGGSESPTVEASPAATPAIELSPAGTVVQGDVCQPDVTEPQPAAGDSAEASGRIMFIRLDNNDRDIWVMNADGSDQHNVTNSPDAPDDEADWSPDGKQIVFFSSQDGPVGAFLFVMDDDGANMRLLLDSSGGDVSPKWSPDGSCIAFSRSGTLAVANADGSNVQIVMEPQPSSEAEPCRAGSFVGGWSPDGQRITYYAAILGSGGENLFWVCAIDYDGSNIEVLVDEPVGSLHAEPAWSPDGRYIVFRDDRDGDYEVYLLDLETGEETNVTDHPGADIEPAWSPDGEWIVFGSMREGSPNFDIYIMRPDGSDLRLLTDHPAKDSYPAWTR